MDDQRAAVSLLQRRRDRSSPRLLDDQRLRDGHVPDRRDSDSVSAGDRDRDVHRLPDERCDRRRGLREESAGGAMMIKGVEATKTSPEETRTRILQATRDIFSHKGFRGTTTREVAERAGVNEATLFRHFGNKEALIEAMFKNVCEQDPATIDELFDRPTGDISTDLLRIASVSLRRMEAKRDLIVISLAEEQRDPTGFNMLWRTPSAVFERGEVRGEPAMLARFFMGMLFSQVMGRCIYGSQDYDELAKQSVDIFLHGIVNKEYDRGYA